MRRWLAMSSEPQEHLQVIDDLVRFGGPQHGVGGKICHGLRGRRVCCWQRHQQGVLNARRLPQVKLGQASLGRL